LTSVPVRSGPAQRESGCAYFHENVLKESGELLAGFTSL
jgi:hypothetical protein